MTATVRSVFHPWRWLRQMQHVSLHWAPMSGTLGVTDGHSFIRMDPRQSQAQRRCTVAHELAHIELGHTNGCSPREDAHASALAARRLIKLDALADALLWTHHLDEVAEALWVDRDTLDTRLNHLHPSEHHYIRARLAAREDGA